MRAASVIAAVVGLLSAIVCFLGLAAEALPYPDPTPEMLAAQAASVRAWQLGILLSLGLSAAGIAGFMRGRRTGSEVEPRPTPSQRTCSDGATRGVELPRGR